MNDERPAEEKPRESATDPASANTQPQASATAAEPAAGQKPTPVEELAAMWRQFSGTVGAFHVPTFVGLGLTLLFLVCFLVPALNLFWWLVLPAAIAAAALLYKQARGTEGAESKTAWAVLWILLGLFVLRDLVLARELRMARDLEAVTREAVESVEGLSDAIPSLGLD